MLKAADNAENSVLSIFSYCTGVQDNEVSLLFVIGKTEACLFKNALYLFAVRDI